ncbi:MAG: hypothetical protein SH809_01225 [Rhodothermales bacterium]|nr:hypothetical protein [Rhodothermales bacterium]
MIRSAFVVPVLVLLLVGTMLPGCSGGSDEREERIRAERMAREAEEKEATEWETAERGDDPQNLGEAMEQLGQALGELGETIGGDAAVSPVDFRDLRDLIPDGVSGMEQTANSGERAGALGIMISKVERTFESSDGNEEIQLSLIDLGSLKNAAMLGFNWMQFEVDREDTNGFERTTDFKGFPAYEKATQHGDSEHTELHVVVAERFVLQLNGRGVDIDDLRDVAGDVDLKQLDKMRFDGVKAVD